MKSYNEDSVSVKILAEMHPASRGTIQSLTTRPQHPTSHNQDHGAGALLTRPPTSHKPIHGRPTSPPHHKPHPAFGHAPAMSPFSPHRAFLWETGRLAPTKPSHRLFIGVVELIFVLLAGGEVRHIDLVTKDAADAAESFHELRPFLASISHEL